jgi:MFS family permease
VPADVGPRHLSLLGGVALALFFEEYDLAMLTAALHLIAADLAITETDFGLYLGLIRLGALPAFLVIPFADRIGRRRVFLVSVLATALCTFATAFVATPEQFVALQMLTRTFFVAGSAVAFVIVTEEFPAQQRGWGIGMLGALGVCGHGFAMLFYSAVEGLPFGWRFLYAVGIVPVLLLPFFRRRIPETQRFRHHARARAGGAPESAAAGIVGSLRPWLELARSYPARAAGIALVGFVPAVGAVCAFQLTGYYTQEVLGWAPGAYAAMVFLGGGLGIIGNIAAGRLGDRYGRRITGATLLGSFPLWVGLFYNGPGWLVPAAWVGVVFASQGGRVILRAFATELFPTSARASASGLFAVLEAMGAALGLFLLWSGSEHPGDFVGLTTLLAGAALLGGLALLGFPETRRRELEAISPGPA